MEFIKNFILFLFISIISFVLKLASQSLMVFSLKKLENRFSRNLKTSGLFMFLSLISSFLLVLFTNLSPCVVVLAIVSAWEKVFSVLLMLTVIICTFFSFRNFFHSYSGLLAEGYKHNLALTFAYFIFTYISDYPIYFAIQIFAMTFNISEFASSIIHISSFSLLIIANIIQVIMLFKKSKE